MAKLYETLSLDRQLALAVRTNSPARLARAFAAHAGQFYDRERFDALAREVGALYQASSLAAADSFRGRLDRRLAERDRPLVAWDPAA
jgi:hypothetical protein